MLQERISSVALLCALCLGAGVGIAQAQDYDPLFPPLFHTDVEQQPTTEIAPAWLTSSREPLTAADHFTDLHRLIPPAVNTGTDWRITKTRWSDADERGYEAFVMAMGRSNCISIDDCLRSPANPYTHLETDDELWLGDCTDMVYVLRGYYAWRNGLPFSFADGVRIRGGKANGTDPRYSLGGNILTSRTHVIEPEGRGPVHAPRLLRALFGRVSTAMLRTDGRETGRIFDDFYPVEITRDAIRPGIIAYDVYGHVGIVYDVTEDGRILLISSHPDYTVTRDVYGGNFLRTGPELGGGLKAWRPIELVGATARRDGTLSGGTIEGERNEDLPRYSLEQYFGSIPDETGDWKKGRFRVHGFDLPYYDFVRARLRSPSAPVDPVADFSNAVDALCSSFRARRTAVDIAIYAGMPDQPHPERLPENIYGTYGDWERYATPSRDARLKAQAVELRRMTERLVERADRRREGRLFAAALLDAWQLQSAGCKLTYQRSDNSSIAFNLDGGLERLFDLSFDPFHCPERRWGALGKELQTCRETADKARWYVAQRYLRNDPERTYDLDTGFEAKELRNPLRASPTRGGLGRAEPPEVDIVGFLRGYLAKQDYARPGIPDAMTAGGGLQ